MSDKICTNCGGQTATGCWLCNPDLHQAKIEEILQDVPLMRKMSGDCVKCGEYKQRIKELEANQRTATHNELHVALTEANKHIKELQARLDAIEHAQVHQADDCAPESLVVLYDDLEAALEMSDA